MASILEIRYVASLTIDITKFLCTDLSKVCDYLCAEVSEDEADHNTAQLAPH